MSQRLNEEGGCGHDLLPLRVRAVAEGEPRVPRLRLWCHRNPPWKADLAHMATLPLPLPLSQRVIRLFPLLYCYCCYASH